MKYLYKALLLALVLCAPAVQAQNVEGQIIASQYGSFQVPGLATGSLQFDPATCQVSGGGKNFAAFTVGVPIKIVDSNPSLNEVDTPAAVFITGCSVSMSTIHIHATPFYLTSGTGGLQEALTNGPVKAGGPNTVVINNDWYAFIAPQNPATVIASVKGSVALGIVDVTSAPYQTYSWNGTQYVANPTGGGANTPATSLVLKGGGFANVTAAAIPGTDYVIPSGNITGQSGTTVALAATPAPCTGSLVAGGVDIHGNAINCAAGGGGGGATTPATTNVLKGNSFANGVIAAVPGSDYLIPSAIPAFSGVAKGSGTTGSVVAAVAGTDYIAPALGTLQTMVGPLATKDLTITDTVNNTAMSYSTGSGGDSTCPAAVAGTSFFCTTGNQINVSQNGAAYAPIGTGGASTPATSSVLKGTGSVNGVVAAVAGTDYLAGNSTAPSYTFPMFTGTSGAYSPQAVPVSYSSFFNQYIEQQFNNNNYTTFGINNLNNIVYVDGFSGGSFAGIGQAPAAWPNTFFTSLSASTAPTNPSGNTWVYTFATPQSAAGGNAWVGLTLPISGYTGAAVGNNGSFLVTASTSIAVSVTNSTGTIVNTGTPVTSQADFPTCQVATYSGNNYIAIGPSNGTTTPGTNPARWWPVPNAVAATQSDCAFATAAAYSYSQNVTPTVKFGAGIYNMNGFIEPQNLYAVNLEGCGIDCSYLNYTGSAAVPMILRADGGNNYASVIIGGFYMYGNSVATSAMDLGQLNQSVVHDIQVANVAFNGDHFFEFGLTPGDAFQMHALNLTWGGLLAGYQEPSTYATITANLGTGGTAGEIVSYTINNGGAGWPNPPASAGLLVHWLGNQGNTSGSPCTTLPTNQPTAVFSGGVLMSLTPVGTGSALGVGCSGTIDVQLGTSYPVNWGIIWNASDSTGDDLIGYAGRNGIIENLAGNNVFHHLHPSVVPNGIWTNGGGTFEGTECDAVAINCFDIFEPFEPLQGTAIYGTSGYMNAGGRKFPGAATYRIEANVTDVAFGAQSNLCGATPGVDWHEFMTTTGPIVNPGDYLTKAPTGMSVAGNDYSCGEVNGDYSPTFTTKSSSGGAGLGANTFTGQQTLAPATPAISGTNQNSPVLDLDSLYFNVSSLPTHYTIQNQIGTGANPAGLLLFNCSTASSGGCQTQFSNMSAINFGTANVSTNGTFVAGNYAIFGEQIYVGTSNQVQITAAGEYQDGSAAPSPSAGTLTGTNHGGFISGLSAATTETITFANSGYTVWASCTGTSGVSTATNPWVSAISKTAVTFTMTALTGTLYYQCNGN